ncbi:MAG: AHH domain-containing protein [Pedobacter sp.]
MSDEPEIIIGKDDQDDPENNHSAGIKVSKFCALRMEICPCENHYKNVIKGEEPQEGSSFKFPRKVTVEQVSSAIWSSQNAHHIICVASLTKILAKDKKIQKIIKNTVYCVNEESNMIALPLFAHTIYWYRKRGNKIEPPFSNLPNHDFDHNLYIDELEDDLKGINGEIKDAGCNNYKPETLADTLKDLSDKYRQKLNDRGRRLGGTHKAWGDAKAQESSYKQWYRPFSMASLEAMLGKSFPHRGFQEEVNKKLDSIKEAILLL